MLVRAIVVSAMVGGSVAQLISNVPTTTAAANISAATSIPVYGLLSSSLAGDFAASIVAVNDCTTTLVLDCAADICETSVALTLTQDATAYQFVVTAEQDGIPVTESASCKLAGPSSAPSSAVCVETIYATYEGQSTSTVTTGTIYASDLAPFSVAVTAGASALSATGSCTASGNAAAATGATEVFKVIVPLGAAALGAAFF